MLQQKFCSLESFGQFLSMCRNMFRGPFISDNLATSMLSLKLDPGDWFVVIVGTVLVFIVDDLLEKFRENAGKALDNDRILLSKVEAGN